jgi:CubicO group peptidase (beta-lactamase class C family)
VVGNTGLFADSLEYAGKVLQQYTDSAKRAGISAIVYKNGEVAFRKNYGFANVENKVLITDSTIFRIYSMSKPVTAATLMTLYDEGKFSLDDPVSKFIPWFDDIQVYNAATGKLEPQKQPITVRHLLTHTAGFTYGWDQKAYVDSLYRTVSMGAIQGVLEEQMKNLAKLPLKFQPGTGWEYGLNIDVAGYLAEVLSGMPLDQLMQSRIFDPLKMNDTRFYVPTEKESQFTEVYTNENGTLKVASGFGNSYKQPVTMFAGGAGLASTIDDYLKFTKMLLNGGELDGVRILKDSTVNLILSNQLPAGVNYNNGNGYGLGGSVDITTGEYGWSGAASTHFTLDRKNNMIIIVMTQYMPFDVGYAQEFIKNVHKALPK